MSCWHSIIQKRIGERAITPRGSWTGELRDPVCRSAVDFCGGTTTKFRCAYFKYKCLHIPWRLASMDFAKVKLFVSEISLKSLVNQSLKISTSTAYDFNQATSKNGTMRIITTFKMSSWSYFVCYLMYNFFLMYIYNLLSFSSSSNNAIKNMRSMLISSLWKLWLTTQDQMLSAW